MGADSKVIFIHAPRYELEDDRLEPPLGILYFATILKSHGFICAICDLSGTPENQWTEYVEAADIYAFSTYSVTYDCTLQLPAAGCLVFRSTASFRGHCCRFWERQPF